MNEPVKISAEMGEEESDIKEELFARDIFVLMQKGCRVSRNIRASWYFKNLDSKLEFKLPHELPIGGNELSLVSVVPTEGGHLNTDQTYNVCIEPHTFVTFLASIYRLAFILDISPSVICVDLFKNQVMYDDLLHTFNNCIRGLVKPFQIPGSCFIFRPELYVTVMLQTPVVQSKNNQVLLQGVHITEKNVEQVLASVKGKLEVFELSLFQASKSVLAIPDIKSEDDGENIKNITKAEFLMSPEAGFVNMLRYGILSLQLLPENSSAGVIVITDGLVGLPDANMFELILTQLRNSTISCSFLKIGSSLSNHQQFGHVPHAELMQFIATATFGAYIANCPKLDDSSSLEPNIYHKALYFWNFQKGLEGFKYELTHQSDEDVPGSLAWIKKKLYSRPLDSKKIGLDHVRKKHLENCVPANIDSVLSLRLREGYTIKEVQIIKGGTTIEVKMVLPWREYVRIEYVARSVWPLDKNVHKTNVEVHIEGSYAFLHEITCQKLTNRSHFRAANVKRFWQAIQSVSQTDKLLAHLQSFSTNTNYYKIPDSIRNGIPLFTVTLPTTSSNSMGTVNLNTQLNSKDSVLASFASFWKPIIMLDTNIWQKWMHCHRIGLVLEHDMPLPKYLHVPNSSGRFHSIGCIQALTSLNAALREWSTFVLKENFSYIKLLFGDKDKPPSFFVVLRVILKGPCMVLRLAFLGGTPSSLRKSEVDELMIKIKDLKFPQRGTQKSEKKKNQIACIGETTNIRRKTPLMRDWSEINCCTVLIKPVEKILVRYDHVPKDMTNVDDPCKEELNVSATPHVSKSTKSATSMFRMLSHYLCHQRWIWTIQKSSNIQVAMSFIGKVLHTLTKIRLQEGFHFAAAESGVVSLVLEIDMIDPNHYEPDDASKEYSNFCKCVVQYVIFPPHVKTTRDSVSEDDIEEMETTEADGELQIVTECWTEPQYGICVNNTPECRHLDGLTADEIAKAFFPVDYECISSLVTYDHLVYLCDNQIIFSFTEPDESERNTSSSSTRNSQVSPPKRSHSSVTESKYDESEPQNIPFPFDLLSLLPWSQQAELLFSTFIMENHDKIKDSIVKKLPNSILFKFLLEDLAELHDKQVPLSTEDCQRFLDILKKRERDLTLYPLPFKYGIEVDDILEDYEIGFMYNEAEGSEKPLTPNINYEQESNIPIFASQSSKSEKNPETAFPIPRWKCYAKAAKQGILSLTFLPASFDDLLILNNIDLPPQELPSEDKPVHIEQNLPEKSEDGIDLTEIKSKDGSYSTSTNQTEDNPNNVHKIPELQRLDSEDPSSVSSSKEEEIAEWINTNALQSNRGLLMVPIYVYSCSQYYISHSLIHRMDFQLPDDEFEDMTFEVSEHPEKYGISPRNHLTSWMESDDWVKEERDDSRSKESCVDATHEFKHLRRNISKKFFSCFVKGISMSLQQNLCTHQNDLDAAINNICEESLPLESDITAFLHASCGHLQHLVNRARKAEAAGKDGGGPRRPSVRFSGLMDDDESESDTLDRIPVILQFPKTTINLSNLVALDEACENPHGLNAVISSIFLQITKKWFRPVASNPDYYFYCSEEVNQNVSEEEEMSSGESVDNPGQTEEDEGLLFGEFVDVTVTQLDEDGRSISLDSSFVASGSDIEDNDSADLAQYDDKPLFIHFTCTLKNRLEQYNVSSRSLPQCVGEILRLIDEDIKEFDLSNLKFTFDINCLTLPSECEPNRKPFRQIPEPVSDQVEADIADMSVASSDRGLKEGLGDPISHLSKKQYKAMMAFKEEIEWLLNDEIVSALRHLYPINSDTLKFVTEHIKKYKKENKEGCDHHVVKLKFVFGANQSLVRFTEEFERLSVPNYSLTKEGDYYFVILNRNHSINIIQAEEIANALVNLSCSDFPEQKVSAHDIPKGFSKIEERSNSLPSLLPSKDSSELALSHSFSMKKIDSADGVEEDGQRHRSCSDAKYLLHSVSGLVEDMTSQVVHDLQPVLPLYTDILRQQTPSHGILKKSSSFASFDTSATTSISCIIPPAQLSPLKPSIDKVRNRHFSAPSGPGPGPGTPQSRSSTLPQTPSWVSSRGSCNEDGYEGDSSDGELDDTHSVSDGGQSHPQLPNFWLILQIHPEKSEIFFHTRDSFGSEANEKEIRERGDRRALLFHVKQNIQSICKKINQRLLLKELNDTRICNSLLVDQAEEDHLWVDKRTSSSGTCRSMIDSTASEGDDDESEDGRGKRYLAARLEFMPGHFACECVWDKTFVLHSRLKEGTKRGGVSRGFLNMKSVLNKLSVKNRINMFVIKETQTDNVFYLRLREQRNVPSGNLLEDDDRLQDQSDDLNTVSSKLEESTSSFNKRVDSDAVSTYSGLCYPSSRFESVELSVYGIEEAGSEIQCDLVKALNCKLDEAVLDVLSLMLNRNPKCKLKSEDVHFIQNTDVTKVIQLSIPAHAMMYLFAMMYYLRQNLLQFLHTPNYDSNYPAHHFKDDINGKNEAVKSENSFLFIRPPANGKGIAFISLSLADSTGSPVKLLNCLYPTIMTSCCIQNEEEFEQFVHTARHDPTPDTSRPGPTALIQFKIWDRFNTKSEMKQLIDKLTAAVKHALCDIVLEYKLMTAPICHIPRQHDETEILHSSVPSSPVSPKGDNKDRRHSVIGKRFSDSLSLKPVIQSASPLQSLKNYIPLKNKFSTPPPQSSPMFEFPESSTVASEVPSVSQEINRTNSSLKEVRMKYESGERGNLHSIYPAIFNSWISFCCKLGTPSINRFELNLLSKFSVDYTLREIMTILPTIACSQTFKLFKLVNRPDNILTGVPYYPCRSPIQPTEDNMETSLDAARNKLSVNKMLPSYCIIGRDVDQWRSVVVPGNLLPESRTPPKNINQKFRPYIFVDQILTHDLLHCQGDFVPRQNLLTIFIQDKQITVATYNWAGDLNNSLEKNITKLVQWHNARIHLLESILNQKMGLFHHRTFADLAYTMDQNPYAQRTYEKEVLIRNLAPPKDISRRHGSVSVKERTFSHAIDLIPQFDEIYKDEQPHIPMHKNSKLPPLKDSVYVHGVQALEIRNQCLKDVEKLDKLNRLYNTWLVKTTANPPVNDDHLKLLKQSSRLFHYCATPILFSSQWRHRVVEKTNFHIKQEILTATTPPMTDIPKSRSRHSSGASIASLKNKRSESQDGHRKTTTPQESPEVQHVSQEEPWHVELHASFIKQYTSYLCNLGFKTLNVQMSTRKRSTRAKSNDSHVFSNAEDSMTTCLQKTLTGGIILMEIGYREEYFCVNMFVFDYTQISININQQMRLLFVDECQRYKDLIHVHSFAHDFHLRCIQQYISGEDSFFNQGFHLTNFLSDFSQIYSYAPSFSRNCLQHEIVVLSDSLCLNDQVFEYMIKQMHQYDMRVVKMKAFVDYDVEPDYCFVKNDEFALVRHRKLINSHIDNVSTTKDADDYDIGLIITHESVQYLKPGQEGDKTVLRLKYFGLLTRRRDCFPMKKLEKRLDTSTVDHNSEPIESETVCPVPVKQHIGVRQEMVDYLGYSNKHQTSIYELLSKEMKTSWLEIKKMVDMSKAKCRRDLLWKRMLLVQVDDEQKKRRRTEEESRDTSNMSRLSYDEFQELIRMVIQTPLSNEDPQLIPLSNMPLLWYRSLVSILITKYSPQHRIFTSMDGQNQCILILNANFLSMFIMLEITPSKAEISVVIQDPISDQENSLATPSLSLISMQSHIEDFVNTCCFHLWSTIL